MTQGVSKYGKNGKFVINNVDYTFMKQFESFGGNVADMQWYRLELVYKGRTEVVHVQTIVDMLCQFGEYISGMADIQSITLLGKAN